MSKWCGAETGILRKKCAPERLEELLVFGYACKLFRDDEKALYVDQGKHLIPWMADEKLKIDRYDCRGALSDLSPYEAGREGYDAMRWLGLSESERKIEQLCDEERYYSLNTNEEEEEMYKEEEIKRLQQKTNEFSYSYDVPQDPDAVQVPNPPTVEEEEREYIPPPELHLPADIAIPKNVKENARVEKTAHFVSKQGPQMEILMKAKQADNPQFSFLNQSDPLYKYYKHVLSAIKGGSYRVDSAPKEEQPKKDENEQQDAGEGSYLHPSLQASPVHQPPPQVPLVSYKPTADCAYSQLVNRIQGTHGDGAASGSSSSKHEATQAPPNQVTYEQQQQYYQYYYAMQYYEYYKQMAAQFHSLGDSDGQNIPPHVQEQINAQAMAFAQMAYTQYVQQNSTNTTAAATTAAATTATSNPYAQIVSNLSQSNKDNNVYPSYQPAQDHASDIITKAPVLYGSDGAPVDVPAAPPTTAASSVKKDEPPEKAKPRAENAPKKALLSLIHYGSDTEESGDDAEANDDGGENDAVPPPDDVRVIIDKMASYVSKNGADFESIVRAKGDARFNFLEDAHEHHAYYTRKLAEFTPGPALIKGEKARTPEKNGVQQHAKAKEKKIITPVSFSIKKSKEEIPKDIRNALPVEESDEEAGEDSSNSTVAPAAASDAPPPVTTTPSEPPADLPERSPPPPPEDNKEEADATVDDPVLDMIDLTDDLEERKDAKRAEDKIKDKLAAAAREKLASAGKDRALQMERKKKAAAFLKLKSAEGGGTTENNREDKILVISDTDERVRCSRSKSRTRDKNPKKKLTAQQQSDLEEGEIKKHRKSGGKKKRSHKRKHSKSRHESRSHQHKKTRKRRRRSDSHNSGGSTSAS